MSTKKNTAPSNKKHNGVVPRLRFPEFRDESAWTISRLRSMATLSTEKVGDKACIPMSITSGVGLVSQMDKFGRIIAGTSYKNYLVLKKNEFAYNKSATKEYPEGFIALYTGDQPAAVPNSIFTCFRVQEASLVPRYLNYLLLGNLHGRWLRKFIEVGARAHGSLSIDVNDLVALPVPLPSGRTSLAEQQKIADCLSSLDDLIAAQARKVEALKAHKKGLMQRLFPREGERQPRWRFSKFHDAGGWETNPLSMYAASLDAGVSVLSGDRRASSGEIGVLKTSCVTEGHFEPTENKVVVDHEQIARLKEPVRAETIIISRMNTVALVGANAYVDRNISNLFLPDRLWSLKCNRSASTRFLAYILGSDRGRAALSAAARGTSGSMKNISMPDVLGLKITAPSPVEQRKIAACLSSLDDLIAAQVRKVEALKTHKKGLMQQLFPRVDGVES